MVWSSRLRDLSAAIVASAAAIGALVTGGATEAALLAVAIAAGGMALVDAWRERDRALAQASRAAASARESDVVAETAAALLASPAGGAVPPRLERTLAGVGARLQICHAPAPRNGEIALPLRAESNSGWLYVDREGPLSRAEAERVLGRIAELVGAAKERSRIHEAAAAAEAERQADLAKTAVMHAISHDLRRPLEALRAAAEHAGDHPAAPALARETAQLERMADDLLDLSRIEAGATNPQRDWCDLADVVAAAAERIGSQRDDVRVDLRVPADLPQVHADRGQLERVFCNLIENAAKFSSGERPIEIRGICANGRVTIRVIDHGQGIAPAQQAQVFKAFVRGSSPESGSGLGLAICRGFVEANGGRIALQSGARDGSAFAVSFPTAKQPQLVS